MENVTIVTDGVCDLSEEQVKKYNISIVPYRIIFGDEVYRVWNRDRYTLSTKEFLEKLNQRTKENLPHTSVPAPGDFSKVFEEALEKADTVIACFISHKLSGTFQSAKRVAEANFPGKDITIFDTAQTMSGTGLLTLEAAKMAKKGKTKEEILKTLENLREKVRNIMVIPDLEYLYLQGRFGRGKKYLASVFRKIPVVNLDDGLIMPVGAFSGRKNLVNQMKNYAQTIIKHCKTDDIVLSYVNLEEEAKEIYEAMTSNGNDNGKTIHMFESSCIFSVYTGFEVLSLCHIGDWNKDWLFKK